MVINDNVNHFSFLPKKPFFLNFFYILKIYNILYIKKKITFFTFLIFIYFYNISAEHRWLGSVERFRITSSREAITSHQSKWAEEVWDPRRSLPSLMLVKTDFFIYTRKLSSIKCIVLAQMGFAERRGTELKPVLTMTGVWWVASAQRTRRLSLCMLHSILLTGMMQILEVWYY